MKLFIPKMHSSRGIWGIAFPHWRAATGSRTAHPPTVMKTIPPRSKQRVKACTEYKLNSYIVTRPPQSTITEESKMAYTSLIEQPTPSSSLISQIAKDATEMKKPSTVHKPAPRSADARTQFHSLQLQIPKIRWLSQNGIITFYCLHTGCVTSFVSAPTLTQLNRLLRK